MQRESSYISLRESRQSSLFNAMNGFDNIDQQLPIEDMKTINRIRKNGKLIFQKQSNGPAPMKVKSGERGLKSWLGTSDPRYSEWCLNWRTCWA